LEGKALPETKAPEVHKALADDTRYRLYRYIGLVARPVSVREMSRRLSLHPNTLRPHLRRLEEAGLVSREVRKTASVGRPQTLYSARELDSAGEHDYRLLAEMLTGLVKGKRALAQAQELAGQWGAYLLAEVGPGPKPGSEAPARRNLAMLRDAMARAGFEPRFRRTQGAAIEITLRDCPFRDLAEDHRELACALHRGLVEGMVGGLKPPMAVKEFHPFAERGICRVRTG
jgi:predicted ArsR family transcriptional regulator